MALFLRDRPVISDSNFGPVIQVISWLLLGLMLLSFVIRLLTKLVLARKLGFDDLIAVIGFVGPAIQVCAEGYD